MNDLTDIRGQRHSVSQLVDYTPNLTRKTWFGGQLSNKKNLYRNSD